MPRVLQKPGPRAAGIACGLLAALATAACNGKPPEQLTRIAPDLAGSSNSASVQAVDVAQATDVASIVVSTLGSQAAIASTAERVRSRFANVDEERAGFYPQVSAGVVSDLYGDGASQPQLSLTGSQMIYDFGRTQRGVSRQVLLARKAHLEFLDTVDEDLTEMLGLLADIESEGRQVALGQARLARMQDLRETVASRTSEGMMTANSLLEADRRVQTAETLLIRAELALASSQRALRAETGMAVGPSMAGVDLSGLDCGAMPLQEDQLTSIRAATVDMAIAEIDLNTARSSNFPTLSLEAVSNHDLSSPSANSQAVNLRIDTSVFRGGAGQSRNQAAQRTAAAAAAALESERQIAQRAYDDALQTVRAQKVLVDSLGAQSDILDQTRSLYLQQFLELGTKTIDEVLDIEEEYHQNLLDTETTRQDMVIAEVDCLAAQGRLRNFLRVEDHLLYGLALR